MEWSMALVCIVGIITLGVLVDVWRSNRPKPLNPLLRDAEVLKLHAQVDGLKKEVEVMTDRGNRHLSARDAAENRLERMHDIFADIIKRTGESDVLRKLLENRLSETK